MKKITLIIFIASVTIFKSQVKAQQRVVLVEQFTNSGCPICATSVPLVMQFIDNNPTNVVGISYHTSFPYNDSIYYENSIESNARVLYYGVAGVPYSIVDGNYYQNSTANFFSSISSTVNNRLAIAAKYTIDNLLTTISGNQLNTNIVLTSNDSANMNDSLRAMIVVIERVVQKNSYAASPGANTETEYKYVMRKMLPNATGNYIVNRNLSRSDTIRLNWAMQHIKSENEVRVVAFVQNLVTKEVYQSILINPSINTSASEMEHTPMNVNIFPVPAHNKLTIEINNSPSKGIIELTDVTGRVFVKRNFSEENKIEINTELLTNGFYLIKIKTDTELITKKIIIN